MQRFIKQMIRSRELEHHPYIKVEWRIDGESTGILSLSYEVNFNSSLLILKFELWLPLYKLAGRKDYEDRGE